EPKNRLNSRKSLPKAILNPDTRVFPQPVQPNLFSALYGTAEAVPFQNGSEKDGFWTGSKAIAFGFYEGTSSAQAINLARKL
ncbi:MAG TPA: hypothetical protein VHX20_11630, partial [Terracidiphilus sp.]|nr:hypothetical protein [Terracidiphilus sp.]